jgi:hypothetical protein
MSWRIVFLFTAALPGAALALVAKPMVLGEGALLLGILLAFAGPFVLTLMTLPANRTEDDEGSVGPASGRRRP